MKRFPAYPFVFALYPILALLAYNIHEVGVEVAIRPALISLVLSGILLALMRLMVKDWERAGMTVTFSLILFFLYGHLYQWLDQHPILGINLGRHRYLVIIYLGLVVLGSWGLTRVKNTVRIGHTLLVIGLVLLVFPIIQIANYSATIARSAQTDQRRGDEDALVVSNPENMPDIYYIILDSYTRADAMQSEFGFDNSPFLDQLNKLGFFVADCSRSNYSFTMGSLSTALNLDYLPELLAKLPGAGSTAFDMEMLIKESLVRQKLSDIGYQIVAFETGYGWSALRDADVFLKPSGEKYGRGLITPFESMLLRSSAGLLLMDAWPDLFKAVNFPYYEHINLQLYILEELPRLADLSGAKFVFVHIMIPHGPFVFSPQGEILRDPGYFGNVYGDPLNEKYYHKGYTGEVQFLNRRMMDILPVILQQSTTPPIIILQGDHGARKRTPLQILNAYYLPGYGKDELYPSISPVNTFRLIFDTYFGTHYGFLPDKSYLVKDFENAVPEDMPGCRK